MGGGDCGIRQWRLADGQGVRKQTGMAAYAISVSSDYKWIVCGTAMGASVWDGEMRAKAIDTEGTNAVWAVDVSPDSTTFATGTSESRASIWNITSGERLIGPLEHDDYVNGIRFSPNGERIATACWKNSIHIFDSQTGDKLVAIKTDVPGWGPATPLAWSSDAYQIFSASFDNKIRSFNTSTGSLLAESQILRDGNNNVHSIALAANGNFIATFADYSMSFLNTSTLTLIGPIIEDSKQIRSIAISAGSNHLATGRGDGKVVIRDLSKILSDLYGPFHVRICAFMISIFQIIPVSSPMAINYIGTYLCASSRRRAISDLGRSRQQDT